MIYYMGDISSDTADFIKQSMINNANSHQKTDEPPRICETFQHLVIVIILESALY